MLWRTTGVWGVTLGRNLTPAELDANFWEVRSELNDVIANPPTANSIASMTVSGLTFSTTLTGGQVLGPFPLPVAQFRWRGAWAPLTLYDALDTFKVDGEGIFSVLADHTSAATFDPAATTGSPAEAVYNQLIGVGTNAALGDLTDVDTAGIADGDFLVYSSGSPAGWYNQPPATVAALLAPEINLDDLADVAAAAPAAGDVLTWTGSPGSWQAAAPAAVPTTLDALSDVSAPSPGDGDVLTYQAGSPTGWIAAAPAASGITALTGDVTAGPGSGSQAATLATVNATVGTFDRATISVDEKGRVTAAAEGPQSTYIDLAGVSIFDLNFAGNSLVQIGAAGYTAAALVTTSRASTGYIDTAAGVWASVGNNTLRYTDKGALIEEARTNGIRNNSMQGAGAGSPGTLPTNWATSLAGLTRTVVGTGTENGVDYIDIRFNGTSTGTSIQIIFETTTGMAALNGQVWAQSAFVSLVAGSFANVTNSRFNFNQRDGAGASLQNNQVQLTNIASGSVITLPSSVLVRYMALRTLDNASTAYLQNSLLFNITNGAAIDFTIRVGWPHAEQGGTVGSPIRTTAGATTRAADAVTMTSPPPLRSIYLSGRTPAGTQTQTRVYWQWDDGTENNRVRVTRDSSGNGHCIVTVGGADQCDLALGAMAADTDFSIAFAWGAGDFAASLNGGAAVTDVAGSIPASLTTQRLGADSAGNQGNFYLLRLIGFRSRVPNATLTELASSAGDVSWPLEVDIAGAEDGQFLRYRSTDDRWHNETVGIGDLSGVDLSSLADGQVLTYESASGDWIPQTPAVGAEVPTLAGAGLDTWLNQGTATVADSDAGVVLTTPGSGGGSTDAIRGRYKAAPETPYKITAMIAAVMAPANFLHCGIGWYDNVSGKVHVLDMIFSATLQIAVAKFATVGSGPTYDFGPIAWPVNPIGMEIEDDGANVFFRISTDGVNFAQLFTIAKASGYLGASGYSNVLFFADRPHASTANSAKVTLTAYEEA